MAPDIIHVGDRYLMYVARNVGAQPRADINLIWTTSLDTQSPEAKWEEAGVVASSDGLEDCNAIDPGLLLDPTDGRLWMVYGSYFGFIRLVGAHQKPACASTPRPHPLILPSTARAAIHFTRPEGITFWPPMAVAVADPTPATTFAWEDREGSPAPISITKAWI